MSSAPNYRLISNHRLLHFLHQLHDIHADREGFVQIVEDAQRCIRWMDAVLPPEPEATSEQEGV